MTERNDVKCTLSSQNCMNAGSRSKPLINCRSVSEEDINLQLDELSRSAALCAKSFLVVKARQGTPKKPRILATFLPSIDRPGLSNNIASCFLMTKGA